jgi:pilus assembly protein Flp/PilA
MVRRLIKALKDEEGASMVEYGLLLALITVVAVAAIPAVGQKVLAAFTATDAAMP